jgi:SAM-dependent methyltransferase
MKFVKQWLRKGKSNDRLCVPYHDARIDQQRFQTIYDRYRDSDPYPGFSKYLNRSEWIAVAIAHFRLAGLEKLENASVLDIGTGAGYFPFVCQNLGHDALGLDIPGHSFYCDMVDLLGIRRREYRIQAFEKLPDFGRRFDRVTAFAICFNNHATESLWGVSEWDFFLNDLVAHQLASEGMITLKFNPEPNGAPISPELLEYLLSRGSEVDGPNVRISP